MVSEMRKQAALVKFTELVKAAKSVQVTQEKPSESKLQLALQKLLSK
jgi:hypothetical protein